MVPSKDGTGGGTWVSGECVAAYCHICVRVWFLQSVYAQMLFWHRIHVLMPFLSQKTEREEFPLQQVSSKGAQPCVKLISYLCLDLFWRVGKDTHPYSWPWERFLSVYREKTLSFKRCLTRNGSEIFPLAFLGKDADKIWIVRPTIASGSQSWWKRGARTKRWPWGDEGEGRGRKGKWRSEMLKGRREKWKQDASMT